LTSNISGETSWAYIANLHIFEQNVSRKNQVLARVTPIDFEMIDVVAADDEDLGTLPITEPEASVFLKRSGSGKGAWQKD